MFIARLTKVLEIPASHIRVIATPNGGGFGGKSDPFNHEVVVCKLAMITGRPVKSTLTREEVFYCHRGRHPVLMHVKTGVKKDGAITGDALQVISRWRRLWQLRRGQHVLHRRAANRHLRRAALQISRVCARLRTSRRAVPSAGTARHNRVLRWKFSSTRSRNN